VKKEKKKEIILSDNIIEFPKDEKDPETLEIFKVEMFEDSQGKLIRRKSSITDKSTSDKYYGTVHIQLQKSGPNGKPVGSPEPVPLTFEIQETSIDLAFSKFEELATKEIQEFQRKLNSRLVLPGGK